MSTELLVSLRAGKASRGQSSLGNCLRSSSMLEAESGFAKGSPLLSQDGGAGLALRPRPVPPNPERPLLVQGPQSAVAMPRPPALQGPSQHRPGPSEGLGKAVSGVRAGQSGQFAGALPPRPGAHMSTHALPNGRHSGAWQTQTHRASDRVDTQPASVPRAEARLHSGASTAFTRRSENSVCLTGN